MADITPTDKQIRFLKDMPTNQLGPAIGIILYEAVRGLEVALGAAQAAVDVLADRLGSTDDDFFAADDWLYEKRPKPPEGSDGAGVTAQA